MSIRLEDNASLLIRAGWNAELVEESQEQDIYTALTGTYIESEKQVPNGIIMEVDMKGLNTMALGLLMDLIGAGTQGDATVVTEVQILKQFQIHAANVRHGVTNDMFGREAELLAFYDMIARANKQIGKWMQARLGKHIRQALVETISDNLQLSPHSLVTAWNRHILCRNLLDSQQPAFSATLATYTSNLFTALGNMGTTSAAVCTPGFFNKLAYYTTAVFKTKALDDGTYIVTVPARQAQILRNLSDTTSLASLQRTTLSEKYAAMSFAGSLGQIGPFILIEDARSPILVRDTADSSVHAYYRDVGDTDARTSYSNAGTQLVYDVFGVHGKAALCRGKMMNLRYDDELSDVGRIRQLVASQTYGVQVTEYDSDAKTDTSRVGQNCALGICYSGTITT